MRLNHDWQPGCQSALQTSSAWPVATRLPSQDNAGSRLLNLVISRAGNLVASKGGR